MEISSNTVTWIWFILGVILLISEFFSPGFVILFFGSGAIIVAAARWIGLVESFTTSIAVWIISSMVLVISLRKLALRLFPPETSFKPYDDDVEAYGKIVEVVKTVKEDSSEGRIRYQGTSWPAICEMGGIQKGKKAKLLSRDNIAWIVEPYDDINDLDIED